MTFSTTIPSRARTRSSPRIANGPSGPVPRPSSADKRAARPAAAVDGRAVDKFERQIGSGRDELRDLADVGRPSANRFRIALPVADDVVGEDVASRDASGAAQKAAHISALNFGWVCVRSWAKPASKIAAQLNYVRGKGDCDPRPTCRRLTYGRRHGAQNRKHHNRHHRPREARRLVGACARRAGKPHRTTVFRRRDAGPRARALRSRRSTIPRPARTVCTSTSAPQIWRRRSSGSSSSEPPRPAEATSAISTGWCSPTRTATRSA